MTAILNVPDIGQVGTGANEHGNDCGAASAAMIIAYCVIKPPTIDELYEEMKSSMEYGVKFSACIACAKKLGVVEKLQELGVEVISWGELLTKILLENGKLLTV